MRTAGLYGKICWSYTVTDKPNKATSDFVRKLTNTKNLTKKLQEGINSALLQHKRAGNPVCEWKDGKVVWISAENIVIKTQK